MKRYISIPLWKWNLGNRAFSQLGEIWKRIFSFADRARLMGSLSATIVLLGIMSGIATYVILSGFTAIKPTREVVALLFITNLVLVLTLAGLVVRRLVILWIDRHNQVSGSRLHTRLVTLFSIIALIPAAIMAIFAIFTLHYGLDRWFSQRTQTIIDNTATIADAYLDEHRQALRRDATAMSSDLNRDAAIYSRDKEKFKRLISAQAVLRSMPMAVIIDKTGKVLSQARSNRGSPPFAPPLKAFELADEGTPVMMTFSDESQVRVLSRLNAFADNAYLYVARFVDARVLEHLQRIEVAEKEYSDFAGRRTEVEITFALIYVGIAFMILLSAIWLGLWVANRLASPIGDLIDVADKISHGDLSARVKKLYGNDELSELGGSFNRMTEQLETQRRELIEAHGDLDERHRFTHAVLEGVSSGVIGINAKGIIDHANEAAERLTRSTQLIGKKIEEVLPAFTSLLMRSQKMKGQDIKGQIVLRDENGDEHYLMVRVTSEVTQKGLTVLTFDDVTSLLSAQRSAAWADIARRIAHEIKNPLTPIQLSAERLHKKYSNKMAENEDVFEQCVTTIVRQVKDIGKMVDEFSSFARMPSAVMREFDILDVVKQVLFLQKVAYPDIDYALDAPESVERVIGDRRQFSQALTNILKNAAESIAQTTLTEGKRKHRIEMWVKPVGKGDGELEISVFDTGLGLPKERAQLTEPYVTSREGGTGLGLVIVKKVMEDHGGRLILKDAPWVEEGETGAAVILRFPMNASNMNSEDSVKSINRERKSI
ncbi:MAG: ATP-binding protein [Parvibaculales bacterium]